MLLEGDSPTLESPTRVIIGMGVCCLAWHPSVSRESHREQWSVWAVTAAPTWCVSVRATHIQAPTHRDYFTHRTGYCSKKTHPPITAPPNLALARGPHNTTRQFQQVRQVTENSGHQAPVTAALFWCVSVRATYAQEPTLQ